ncbi:acyl transferase domain-containing protein [Xylariaceae sp. FL1019]|nr:acyl transferase domain-containing protein [Xylariaceae sp. FL1019]
MTNVSKVPWESAKLTVPTNPMSWPKDRDYVIGVNSFGVGGSNAHAVLGSAESFGAGRAVESASEKTMVSSKPALLLFSAKHPDALKKTIESHQAYHLAHPNRLANMSYSLAMKRDAFEHRAFAVTDGLEDWSAKFSTRTAAPREPSSLVFVFSGQGAQWAQMGKELTQVYPSFEASIQNLDKHLQALGEDAPSWSLLEELLRGKKTSRLAQAELAQPCTTALQIALVDLLRERGLAPDAVVGHSSGEIAGAYASGALTAREAIIAAYYRGKAMPSVKETLAADGVQGSMAAVGLGAEQVMPFLTKGVLVGCENSPDSTTLTGDKDALEGVMGRIKEAHPDTLVRALKVDCAYHSHHMRIAAPHYLASLEAQAISPKAPSVPFHSSVTGKVISSAEDLGPQYWIDNLVSRVRFSTAVASVLSSSPKQTKTFIEVGPHSTLAGPIRQILQSANAQADYVNVMARGQDSSRAFLQAMGELWGFHVPLDLATIVEKGDFLTDLPLYSWHYEEPLWLESRLSKEFRFRKFPHHELLGSRVLESTDHSPSWRNLLKLSNVPWISDHIVFGDTILPGVGFVAMAGEAIRQLTGAPDFTVQRVHIKVALALEHDSSVELVTQLDRVALTNSLDAAWYDWSISSYRPGPDGSAGSWTKHAFGQVRSGSDFLPGSPPDVQPLERAVSSKGWYRKFRASGLDYGPRFQGLANTTAHPSDPELVGTIANDVRPAESYYPIHPGALDTLAQSLVLALCSGLTRNLDNMAVPTYIDELYCRPPATQELAIRTRATERRRNAYIGDMTAISDGQIAVQAKGFRLTVIDNSTAETEGQGAKFGHGAVQLEWKPDITFADVKSLFTPDLPPDHDFHLLDQYLALAAIECAEQWRNMEPAQEFMGLFAAWNEKFVAESYSLVDGLFGAEDSLNLRKNSDHRKQVMDKLYEQLLPCQTRAAAVSIQRIVENSKGLMRGTVDGLDILMEDKLLHDVYDGMQLTHMDAFLQLLGHKKPNLRVLEIGAGTGGTTAKVLPALQSAYGERLYLSYTYTDISPGFFPPAQERFAEYPGIEYRVLDISQDPVEQGFGDDLESYDLIISTNCLHATPRIQDTLRNVRKLTHPRGRLFLQELSPVSKWPNMIMGVLPGWWLGAEDDRPDEPYMDEQRWDKELTKAGFCGAQDVMFDGRLCLNIVTTPTAPQEDVQANITLLVPAKVSESTEPQVRAVTAHLQGSGYRVNVYHFGQDGLNLGEDEDVVALLDLERPFFHDMEAAELSALQGFVAHAKDRRCGILWVTGASQAGCTDPRYAPVLGVARVLRLELGMDFATLEMAGNQQDGGLEVDAQVLGRVLDEFRRRERGAMESEADTSCEAEWVHLAGNTLTGRYHYLDIKGELTKQPQTALAIPAREQQKTYLKLDTLRPGLLETLYWKRLPLEELGRDELRVEVRAVGLNFKDVLVAMGVIAEPEKIARGMGYDCSGVVTAVGSDVTKHRVGDRVFVLESGTFATSINVSELLCSTMPDDMSYEEAATMPLVFATASYSLFDAAHLTKGMTVLIHAAAGGVGLAAIQLCNMVGAEIYCSVGSEDKVQHLVEQCGIPRDHIFNSRDTSFLPGLMDMTNGRGADIVLNSLSGDLLHASWKCVAPGGAFVEIGRRDFIGQAKLAMEPFEFNRAFVGVDLGALRNQRPTAIAMLLDRMTKQASEGHIKPIAPMWTYAAANVQEPIRLMQKAQHIGKMVITMPENADAVLPSEAAHEPFRVRGDGAYLLTGGLGGLGKSTSTWLAERGARHLVYLSRSAESPEHKPFLQELAALGCTATAVSGDATNYDDVVRAVKAADRPICGVLHATLVLDDNSFVDLTFDQWNAPMKPKVQGAWNLHKALADQKLDFFFLFSSFGCMFGQWGQSNYSAANTFIDAFVSYRHSQGLPASAINIGVMGDVGWVAENPEALEKLQAAASYVSGERDFLECAELMFMNPGPNQQEDPKRWVQQSQVGFGLRSTLPILSPNNRVVFRKDPRMLVYRTVENDAGWSSSAATPGQAGGDSADEELARFLQSASTNMSALRSEEAKDLIARTVGRTLFGFMLRPDDDLNVNMPMADVGIDSLVSIELRNWVRKKLGVEVNVLEITRAASLKELGGTLQMRMIEKYQARR